MQSNSLYGTRLWCCLFFLLLLGSCDSGGPQLTQLQPGSVILAFGDSLTEGKGTALENSYPAVLEKLSGMTVINAGISGETTSEGLARLPDELEQHQPDLLILFEGGNDILRNQNLEETRVNLASMIELARQQNIEVLLVGVPNKNLFASAAPLYTELAEQYQLPFASDQVASLMRKMEYKSDSVHFNAGGYARLAEDIHDLLKKHGAL